MIIFTNNITPQMNFWEGIRAFDDTVYKFISSFISDNMTVFMKFISFLGSGWTITFFAVIIPFIIFVFRKRSYYRLGLFISANIALGALLNQTLKYLFRRPRPGILRLAEVGGYSFPSGHSMNSMIFYGIIAYQLIKNVKTESRYLFAAIIGLLILLIGISRIYLGVHYASDVLAGFLIGLGWDALAVRMSDRLASVDKAK